LQLTWPDEWLHNNGDIPKFLLTVDGVHCVVREPSTAELSKNPAYFSHKHHHAGVDYEIGLSVFTNQVVWVNGPFPAGENDISIFKNRGLREMIPEGSWAIADNGYRGILTKIRTSSSLDTEAVRRLKSRAKARHESFNGKLKNFAVVRDRWRHKINKHAIAFKAVCVICQYQMENGSPLWDV
jgi:DDE superfamily endonuclease